MRQRVVITGMGMVTCLGSGIAANWDAILAGRSGIGPISLFDAARFASRIAGEVHGEVDPSEYVPQREKRRMDRFQLFAMVAAAEAAQAARVDVLANDPYRCGVVIGSGMGGLKTIEDGVNVYIAKGPKSTHPLLIPKAVINLGPGMLSMRYGFKGINFGVVNACTSGTSAIGEAYRIIREGRADVMLTGGAEAVVTELSVAAFCALRALSTRNDEPEKASRPFDKNRDGFVIAEGAGMMVLESLEHARDRGVQIFGEIVGYGATGDAYHFVMPDPDGEGAYRAMKIALEDAGLDPDQIDYINAHGTSTALNDVMETRAIRRLFGQAAEQVAVSSTKSMTGHLIGAAGAVEGIYCVLAMNEGIVPPTVNLDDPDPECDLDYTPKTAVKRELEFALSNSFAFGGQNACLAFRKIS